MLAFMTPSVPSTLLDRAARWDELKRWERRELGQELRRLGLSYGEIASIVPVSQGTLSGWCRGIALTEPQQDRIRAIRPHLAVRMAVGRQLHARALDRAATIRVAARAEAKILAHDPLWSAGVVAYWAEGAKRPKAELRFSNSDPALVALFVRWARRYLELGDAPFEARLHLHDGQEEGERRAFWSRATGIALEDFRKAFIKGEGTEHRKNVLYNGTIAIRVRSSGAMFHRVMGWIDGLQEAWAASSTG